MDNFFKQEVKNYSFILIGSICLAIGVVSFLLPNSIITGGTAGLALLLHHVTPLTIGSLIVLVNAPLLLVGMKYLGKAFAIRTVITIILTSLVIDFFAEIINFPAATDETILASIFGGIFIGLGLGLVIKGNSSAGGSTIVARIVSTKTEIKPGQVILIIDSIIILMSTFVFNDLEKTLWSIISIYVTTKIIDVLLTGRLNKKVVYLVTNRVDEINEDIKEKLGPDGTVIEGVGLNGEDKRMILIVVEVSKLQTLRDIIRSKDKDAFMVITEASEMLGRGN